MSLRNVPPQSHYLYDDTWNAKLDSYLLSRLVEQRAQGNWNPSQLNYHAVMIGKTMLEDKFGVEYSWEEVYDRIMVLKQRYDTFKYVVNSQGVWWDRVAKKVFAEQTVWRGIVEEKPFALAYYHSHEPEMDDLTKTFGPEIPTMAVKPIDIIEISDGSLPQASVRDHISRTTILLSDEDDEVVSPVLNRKKIRLKLIDEVPRRPGTYPPDFFVKAPKASSSSKSKFPKVSQAASSSCDSFSPKKWLHFPEKHN